MLRKPAIEQGINTGREETRIETTRTMKDLGLDPVLIMKGTGLNRKNLDTLQVKRHSHTRPRFFWTAGAGAWQRCARTTTAYEYLFKNKHFFLQLRQSFVHEDFIQNPREEELD